MPALPLLCVLPYILLFDLTIASILLDVVPNMLWLRMFLRNVEISTAYVHATVVDEGDTCSKKEKVQYCTKI